MGTTLPFSELERMAGELKCPICLSLYKQAASLSCNHCFCNSCIMQSMKRISCCPICKVPATPREVRSAPQMDSLVTIFKGMETAAGVTLFHTQQPSQLKSYEAGKLTSKQKDNQRKKPPKGRGNMNQAQISNAPPTETANISHLPKKRRRGKSESVPPDSTFQGVGSSVIQKGVDISRVRVPVKKKVRASTSSVLVNITNNIEESVINSFSAEPPAKTSSIRMANHAFSEENAEGNAEQIDPTSSFQTANPVFLEDGEEVSTRVIDKQGIENAMRVDSNQEDPSPKGHHDVPKTRIPLIDDSGALYPQLSPFFWLRDRTVPSQDELPTQPTQVTQTQGAARPLRPSFSDLKSSDDDDQSEDAQQEDEGAGNEVQDADSYDSDAFLWSQRPCSPELASSPLKMFDQPLHFNQNSLDAQERLLGKEGNSRRELVDDLGKSPLKSVIDTPVEVEATQTPQLHQEPSRMTRGTLLRCSTLPSRDTSHKSSSKVCRRLKSNDPSSILSKDNCQSKLVGPKKAARNKAQVHENVVSRDPCCEEIRRESNVPSSSDDVPVDVPAEVTLQSTSPQQGLDKRDAVSVEVNLQSISPQQGQDKSDAVPADVILQSISPQQGQDKRDAVPECEQIATSGGKTGTGDENSKDPPACVFCRSADDSEVAGPLVEYQDVWPARGQKRVKAVHVHKLCAEWAPDVYFDADEPKNLACEVNRGQKIKCSSCGIRGAALGCCNKRCKRSFHYPCGRATAGCKWDEDDFVMFCPKHADCKFPTRRRCRIRPSKGIDLVTTQKGGIEINATPVPSTGEGRERWAISPAYKWVLCGSGLDPEMKKELAAFASVTGASMVKRWNPSVTHVITRTDEQGRAARTLKFLMAMLQGKWIVKTEWMNACISAGHIVGEDQYEVASDINGFACGPNRSRARAEAKGPKLFEGLSFYFFGEFSSVSREDLQSLIVSGRGVVLHRKPLPRSKKGSTKPEPGDTVVLYDGRDDVKKTAAVAEEAGSLATNAAAFALPHSWLLDSVAACQLLHFEDPCPQHN